MFKVIAAEIKKIVSKPGIYILSSLLAIILVLGVFIYKPKVYETTQFELNGVTFVEKYAEFMNDPNKGEKAKVDTNLKEITTAVKSYRISADSKIYTQKEYVSLLLDQFNAQVDAYRDCTSNDAQQTYINNLRTNQLVPALEKLNEHIESTIINHEIGAYSIITTKKNYEEYKSSYKELLKWAKTTVSKENLKNHFIEFDDQYSARFYQSLNEFKYPELSDENINTYSSSDGKKLKILNERKDDILSKIHKNYLTAISDANFNTKSAELMDELANEYVNTLNTFITLAQQELIVNAFKGISTKDQLQLLNLNTVSEYNSKSLLAKYDYLFEKNKSDNDFSNPLTIGVASDGETNGYDYAYFVLRVFSFVIIIYAIMSACHTIAGELKEGTMRYLSIRPVNRTELFFGKWLAILIMSLILILFSAVISICVGAAVYGLSSHNILTIFNGTTPIVLHPLGMIGIYLVSMVLELIIYSMIAMMFSVLLKSDLISMTILIVVYLLNALLPMFIQGANTWLAFYPFSHISLYALFGSSLYAVPSNFFNLIFGAKIYAGTHILLTSSIIAFMILIPSIIAIRFFKRKEL